MVPKTANVYPLDYYLSVFRMRKRSLFHFIYIYLSWKQLLHFSLQVLEICLYSVSTFYAIYVHFSHSVRLIRIHSMYIMLIYWHTTNTRRWVRFYQKNNKKVPTWQKKKWCRNKDLTTSIFMREKWNQNGDWGWNCKDENQETATPPLLMVFSTHHSWLWKNRRAWETSGTSVTHNLGDRLSVCDASYFSKH